MESTPLHHKPIIYGSRIADLIFLVAVVLHVLPALAAPISGIVAVATRKGKRIHVAAGRIFVWSMAIVAITGIGLDLVRLTIAYDANHTKYAGTSNPSTIPARLAFLFAGMCVVYLLLVAAPPRVFKKVADSLVLPGLLFASAVAFTVLIILRYNPWTGSLWMIWIMSLMVVLTARSRGGVPRHRVGMASLAAFSWWGALQGFIPGIVYAIRGVDPSTTPYVGDQPGPFTPFFFVYLVGWLLPLVIAALVVRRFRLRHGRVSRPLHAADVASSRDPAR